MVGIFIFIFVRACKLLMEPPGMESGLEFPKNPLLCPICHDYFTEPCILSCYHTFCARCLRGREQDRRLICPFCRYDNITVSILQVENFVLTLIN